MHQWFFLHLPRVPLGQDAYCPNCTFTRKNYTSALYRKSTATACCKYLEKKYDRIKKKFHSAFDSAL